MIRENIKNNKAIFIPRVGRREFFTIGLLIAEIAIFSFLSPNFLTPANITTVVRNSVDLAIISIGTTMVMILGGVDLSSGGMLGVVAILVGWMLKAGWNPFLIALLSIGSGILLGFLNGSIIVRLRVPDLIGTLATSNIFRAAIFFMLEGSWIMGINPVFGVLTREFLFGFIPTPLISIIVIYFLAWFFLSHTKAGRRIYAVGNSREAALYAGINVDNTRILAYMLLGGLVGYSALLYVGRMSNVENSVGNQIGIMAIAATIVGGTSVTAGRGSVLGTLAGVFFMTFMKNGIIQLGIPSLMEKAAIGGIIIISVASDILLTKRSERIRREQINRQRFEKDLIENNGEGIENEKSASNIIY